MFSLTERFSAGRNEKPPTPGFVRPCAPPAGALQPESSRKALGIYGQARRGAPWEMELRGERHSGKCSSAHTLPQGPVSLGATGPSGSKCREEAGCGAGAALGPAPAPRALGVRPAGRSSVWGSGFGAARRPGRTGRGGSGGGRPPVGRAGRPSDAEVSDRGLSG